MAGRGNFQVRSLALSQRGADSMLDADRIQAITYECYDADVIRQQMVRDRDGICHLAWVG